MFGHVQYAVSTYHDEIDKLRPKFAAVNKTDPVSLRRWFESHSHLRTSDHAQIARRDLEYIRGLKKLAGLGGRPVKNRPTRRIRKVVSIDVPEDWDTKEWLEKAVQLYSTVSLSKAIGVSYWVLYRRYKKYGIKQKGIKEASKPNNPCCTKAWVYEHYVVQGLSQRKCAKLAGLTTGGFTKWLVRFEIPVRSTRETFAGRKEVKVWCRRFLHNLENQPIVRKCFVRKDHIHVRFYNYYWETYYLDKSAHRGSVRIPRSFGITEDQSQIENVPSVLKQYESDLGSDSYAAHIIIPMVQWKKASFMERRLCVHEFTRQIITRGWIDPDYPQWVLDEEWSKLQNLNSAKYLSKSTFTAYPNYGMKPPPGRRVMEQFFDLSELWEIIKSPRWTIQAVNAMVERNLRVYDTHNFYRSVMRRTPKGKTIPRVVDPGFYSILFKRLGITGKVLDLTPGHGSRATACALNGLTYQTLPNPIIQKAMDRGFADYTGLNYEEYDNSIADLVILDNDLRKSSIPDALRYASKAKRLLVFVPRNEKSAAQAKYKPSSVIQVKARCHGKTPDFYFLW